MSDISFTLIVFGVLFLLLLSISIYAQRPRFGGTSPKAIEVVVFRPFSNEIAYRTDITNRAACEKLLQDLGQARFTFFGFKPTGVLNIQYDNGRVDHLKFTQCNDGTHSLTFRLFYEIPSRQFCRALKEAGVDVSRFEGAET
ncbi:MAG TPA: hypothetical protein VN784_03910 [Candidatus Limnocylindrales bacterium]|nr:hypothetical protein [Candidatus Limnocylindrales bacterium]